MMKSNRDMWWLGNDHFKRLEIIFALRNIILKKHHI